MEAIAPPLDCLLYLKFNLEQGKSLSESIKAYIAKKSSFSETLSLWFHLCEDPHLQSSYKQKIKSIYRVELLNLLEVGLKGVPILTALNELEKDIILASEDEMEEKLKVLPLFCLIPLLLLQFPALVIIILGPFIDSLMESFL